MKLGSIFLAAAIACCGLASAGAARAATFSVQTTPDQVANVTGLKGGSTVTFNDLAPGSFSSVSSGGVTINSNTGSLYVTNQYQGAYNTFGNSLSNNGHAFSELVFQFSQPITGFGFFFGASDVNWTLSAYDASNNLIDSLLISPVSDSNAGDFFGILGDGIVRATLVGQSSDFVFIDNFTTGGGGPISAVPEPATWAMMILGFGLAGSAVRSTRRRQTAFA